MKSSNLFEKEPAEADLHAAPRKPKPHAGTSNSPTQREGSKGLELFFELTALAVLSAFLGYAVAVALFGS